MIRRRVVVTGDVQGVYFRDTCRMTADGTGVAGWVRNRPDGTVEAVFEGPPEAVAEMVAWSQEGSPLSIVDRVEVVEEEPEGLTGFEIRPTPWRD
ncbi:acylphosphatase [Actinacidiphila glaucinigra]|uniref:acylphosphatase n=1 Tax=Actinacidiphila glaucinigra TaxID=235986 RepID=UPI0029B2C5BD|nr:acylphosphatase [Streptomyces sp. PA03-3a]